MEEVGGLTVGKVTTMNPLQANCKRCGRGASREFILVHRWDRRQRGVNSPRPQPRVFNRMKRSFELPSYIRNPWCGFIRVSRRKVNEYADP
jgi:hypothetical protein